MMIRKTLTVTIALILLWSVIVKLLPQDLNTYQSQRDRNLILAQDYLYSTPNIHEKRLFWVLPFPKELFCLSCLKISIILRLGGKGFLMV